VHRGGAWAARLLFSLLWRPHKGCMRDAGAQGARAPAVTSCACVCMPCSFVVVAFGGEDGRCPRTPSCMCPAPLCPAPVWVEGRQRMGRGSLECLAFNLRLICAPCPVALGNRAAQPGTMTCATKPDEIGQSNLQPATDPSPHRTPASLSRSCPTSSGCCTPSQQPGGRWHACAQQTPSECIIWPALALHHQAW